jgi:hypothetical protein
MSLITFCAKKRPKMWMKCVKFSHSFIHSFIKWWQGVAHFSTPKCEWKCAKMIKRWWVSSLWVLKKAQNVWNSFIHSFIHSLNGDKESLILVRPNVNENVPRWLIGDESHHFVCWKKAQNVNEMCKIHSFIHSLSGDKESLVLVCPNVNGMCQYFRKHVV